MTKWWKSKGVGRDGLAHGHLYYVDDQGEVHDFGPVGDTDFSSFLWASQVAYRLTRDRGERTRLAAIRSMASEFASTAQRVQGKTRLDS